MNSTFDRPAAWRVLAAAFAIAAVGALVGACVALFVTPRGRGKPVAVSETA